MWRPLPFRAVCQYSSRRFRHLSKSASGRFSERLGLSEHDASFSAENVTDEDYAHFIFGSPYNALDGATRSQSLATVEPGRSRFAGTCDSAGASPNPEDASGFLVGRAVTPEHQLGASAGPVETLPGERRMHPKRCWAEIAPPPHAGLRHGRGGMTLASLLRVQL